MKHLKAMVLGLVLALFPIPSYGEDSLVIMDGTDAILGPVVGVTDDEVEVFGAFNEFRFLYRQGGSFTILKTYSATELRSAVGALSSWSLYYESSDCSGAPAMISPAFTSGPYLTPPVIIDGADLWLANYEVLPPAPMSSRRSIGSSLTVSCVPFPPQNVSGNSVQPWGTITFTPPLRLALNPLIFNDGFGSGDTSRWRSIP